MEDDAALRGSFPNASYQIADLRRYCLADGVANDDIVGARGAWIGGDSDDPLRIGQPLERTGERGSDTQLNRTADLLAIRTASGIAAILSSVVRPMLALLWESEAEKQYWKLRAPAAAAFSTCLGVATQIQHRSSSSGSSAATTSSVSASGGTRSGRAIEPISSVGTPSANNSRMICTLRSVGRPLAVS